MFETAFNLQYLHFHIRTFLSGTILSNQVWWLKNGDTLVHREQS